MRRIRIGTRGSRLALVQTHSVADAIRAKHPEVAVVVEIIETQGDRVLDRPLSAIGDAGVFIKEIEAALLEERVDLAVHSMKDLPSKLTDGLALAATTERFDPRDVLVARSASSLETLPRGGTVATGSLRRRSQLLALRPDLKVEDLRGNVPTRLEKFDRSTWDAIILAGAGLERLGLATRIRSYIPIESMLPAVGQGALALETRASDREIAETLAFLSHAPTERAVVSERSFLARLEGGCRVPIAAYAEIRGGSLSLRGYVGAVDGSRHLRREIEGDSSRAEGLGLELAESMLAEGAAAIIRQSGETA
ncbi:MAG TPA: hydroxymethylbilane synthase [Vicinamibacteria bacterium]|nr:hydroxymethylbilane synthase [Vicinamibacteria bacterium]